MTSWTPLLLVLVVVLLVVILFLFMRPVPAAQPPMVVVMHPPTSRPLPSPAHRTPPSPVVSQKAYGGTTLTYRTSTDALPTAPVGTADLNQYYPDVPRSIPTDFTMESCPCPFSKPQKTDLPMPSLPLCTILQQSSYKLSEFK